MAGTREIDRPGLERSEIEEQVARESERRARLGVPAAAGGVLYLLSGIILTSTLKGIPTVGVLQGVAPALRGEASPAVSPRAAEIKFQSHHAFGLIAGSVLVALAYAALLLVLLLLLQATSFRRPETNRAARGLLIVGGVGVALLSVLNQIIQAIHTHNFATGHDFGDKAVEGVIHSTSFTVLAYLTPLAGISLAAGMIITMRGSVKVGLLPRWIGMVGVVSAFLLLLPTAILDLVPAFWMVAVGILLMGRLPSGDPPAWASGEATPWPSQFEQRDGQTDKRKGAGDKRKGAGGEDVDLAPEPAQPATTSNRRRRKRGSRK